MELVHGIIRKITVGDIKDGITYVVGQPIMRGRAKITAIVQDDLYFRILMMIFELGLLVLFDNFSHYQQHI